MEGFRALVRGWFGKVLLALFSLPFMLFGAEKFFVDNTSSDSVATVDGQTLSQHDLEQQVNDQHTRLLQKLNGNSDLIDDQALRHLVQDKMIERMLLQAKAQKLGFTPSDAQIIEFVHKIPQFQQQNGQFSQAMFQFYLKQAGQTVNGFMADFRTRLAVDNMVQGISDSALQSTVEVDRQLALQSEKREVQVGSVLASPYLPQVTVSDADIAKYYQAHQTDLKSAEQVNLDYVVFNRSSLDGDVTVEDDDLKARYAAKIQAGAGNEQRHVQQILIAVGGKVSDADAKKKADGIEAQLKAGANFGSLAKANSDDLGSVAKEGDLGFASRDVYNTYDPDFAKALFAMKQGETSAPIRSKLGYHIIKLLETKGEVPTFDSMKAQLMVDAHQDKLNSLYNDKISQINEQAASSDSLVDLAKAYNLSITHSGLISRTSGVGDLANKDLLSAAFTDDITKDRKLSTGVAVAPDHTIWFQATQYLPIKPLTLAEATPKIRSILQMQGAIALARTKAQEVVKALNAGKSVADAAQASSVTFQNLGEVTRQAGPSPLIMQAAFALTAPDQGHVSSTTVDAPGGVVVVAVSKVIPVSITDVKPEDRKQLQDSLSKMHGQQDLEDYQAFLKSQAKIKISTRQPSGS